MGALLGKDGEDNPAWQHNYRPSDEHIFTLSRLDVATMMGMWLMPKTGLQPYMTTFPNDDDLEQIIEDTGLLVLQRALGDVS